MNKAAVKKVVFALFVLLITTQSRAGFLEMPNIEELPEAENDILLKDLDIPSVNDRSPDPEDGLRLNVTEFRVQGIVEFPELGITRESIIKFVEESRYNIMKEGQLLYSGYTNKELSELQDIIVDIEKNTRDVHVGPMEVQRLVFLIRNQRRRRGVTLSTIEDVADKVTEYYRQRGFILAKAFIPEQHVRDGVVTLTLMLGDLGKVDFVHNKRYSSKTVDKIFSDLMYKPVTTSAIEQKLYYLNDMPGLNVQGFFGPGEQVGDTKLTIRAETEESYSMNFRIDNHGSDTTGEYRLYGDLILNNPLKYGDQLHLSLLAAVEPESSEYGAVRYSAPLFSHRWHYELGASQNAFVIGLERLSGSNNASEVIDENIEGKSETLEAGFRYQLTRSRVNTTSLGLTFLAIDAEVESAGVTTPDRVNNTRASYNFDFLNQKDRVIHNGAITLTRSLVMENSAVPGVPAYEDAWIVGFNYTSVRFMKPLWGKSDFRWVIRSGGQYSGEWLSSINQFALAGPTRSRAYKTNTFFSDDGIYLGAEVFFEAPNKWSWWSKKIQPYVFSDLSYGEVYTQSFSQDAVNTGESGASGYIEGKNRAFLFDAGLGLKLSFSRGLRGSVSIAAPMKTEISNELDLEDIDDVKFYFDMQYSL